MGRNRITRILPRGVRSASRVQESGVSARSHVDHDGYLAAARLAGKRDRPLLLDLNACPGDPYILFHLGKDAE